MMRIIALVLILSSIFDTGLANEKRRYRVPRGFGTNTRELDK